MGKTDKKYSFLQYFISNSTILKALNGSYCSFITLAILMPLMEAYESHRKDFVFFSIPGH